MGLVTNVTALAQAVAADIKALFAGKVDKVGGMGLSSNDFTSILSTKLAGVAIGAQVNVITTVAGRTGDILLANTDVGLGNVNNTSDINKPVSTLQAIAIANATPLSILHAVALSF